MFHAIALHRVDAIDTYNRDVILAWRIEFFARQKELKAPNKYMLRATPPTREAFVSHQRGQLEIFAAQYGLKFRKARKKKKGGP